MSPPRLSDQLLLVAKARLADSSVLIEANLRRTTSDLYYAVFHAICEALVEPLSGDPGNPAFVETYTCLYRQLEHGQAERRCKTAAQSSDFPVSVSRFAKLFVTLKNKREAADYHPLEQFKISIVRNDLETTETRLRDFWSADRGERATFACYVGLRLRRETST